MIDLLIRIITIGLVNARAGGDAWAQRAMMGGGRADLEGTFTTVATNTATDRLQSWMDVWGTASGNPAELVIQDGDAAGQRFPIELTSGETVRVTGDLQAAGVRPGDEYLVVTPRMARAAKYLASTDVPVSAQFPSAQAQQPSICVLRQSSSEQSTQVGRDRTIQGDEEWTRSTWNKAYGIICTAPSVEAVEFLGAAVAQAYRNHHAALDAVFKSPSRLQVSGPQINAALTPDHFSIQLTLTGEQEQFGFTRPSLFFDEQVGTVDLQQVQP